MTKVQGLGHVGVYVKDLEREVWFFRDVLGLTVTDRGEGQGFVFLSARPEEEHHEILLIRDPEAATRLNQLSFYCDSLAELKVFYQRFLDNGIEFDHVVTHGIAVGIYVHDPEGNMVEVYWRTGVKWRQPFRRPIDLTRSDEEIMAALTTGHAAPAVAAS